MALNRRSFLAAGAALAGSTGLSTIFGMSPAFGAPPTDTTATLTTYNWGNPDEARAYADAFGRFNATYPNVTVVDNIAPVSSWSDYADKLDTDRRRQSPDIINIAIEGLRLGVNKGLLIRSTI